MLSQEPFQQESDNPHVPCVSHTQTASKTLIPHIQAVLLQSLLYIAPNRLFVALSRLLIALNDQSMCLQPGDLSSSNIVEADRRAVVCCNKGFHGNANMMEIFAHYIAQILAQYMPCLVQGTVMYYLNKCSLAHHVQTVMHASQQEVSAVAGLEP